MSSEPTYQYDAFISYRHVEPDRGWAKWLHGALETYRVPKAMVAKGLPRRLTRIFRDEEELPVSSNLSNDITSALDQSKFLIVVCSRRAPDSKWVNAEVEHFRKLGRHDRILALLIDGEPKDSFPPALTEIRRTITDTATGRSCEEIEEVEPLAADVRPERTDIKANTLRSHARLRILACILGCRFDDLRQRETERRAVRLRRIGVGLAGLVAVMGGLTIFAFKQQQAALEAGKLANARLEQAQEARNAAEDLVTEAIFGLRDKLVPLGKLNVMEDMASAAEEYYAKLPAELVSDVTRRHQVKLALNRAMIATVSSDDETIEASAKKSLALARELSTSFPNDESLREDQYYAHCALALLRYSQFRNLESFEYGQELSALAEEWLQATPKSPVALRAKLVGQCIRLLSSDIGIRGGVKDSANLFSIFQEAQATAEEVKQAGGETLETRLVVAISFAGKAIMMSKLQRPEEAIKLFAKSDEAFRVGLAEEGNHWLLREFMLIARKWSVRHLAKIAKTHGDKDMQHEAYQQYKALIEEVTTLAEFEPARLVRWANLIDLYLSAAWLVKIFEDEANWLAYIESGIAASNRAMSTRFDRPGLRGQRSVVRVHLCGALYQVQPADWNERVCKALAEIAKIQLAPSKAEPYLPPSTLIKPTMRAWGMLLIKSNDSVASIQALAMADYGQAMIDLVSESPESIRPIITHVRNSSVGLRRRGLPEADHLSKLSARWQEEFDKKFGDQR